MCAVNWQLVLNFFELLLNWPFLAFVVVTSLLFAYRAKVGSLIDRISRVGPVDIQPRQSEAVEAPGPVPEPTSAELVDVDQLAGRAIFFEFQFLNYFLAPATQQTLDWLGVYGPISRTALDVLTFLQPYPDGERKAIVEALSRHDLIVQEPLLSVTEKGNGYIAWPGRRVLSATPSTSDGGGANA